MNKSVSAAKDAAISDAEAAKLFGPLSHHPALIVAVSGGPDSTALMVLAARWRGSLQRGPTLVAVTIDHGLRPEARSEALAVKLLARTLGLKHRTLRWTGPKPKSGIQEAAREARYRLLAKAAREAKAAHILTAHTVDDQAETVLFRLAHGSGLGGLAGIRSSAPVPVPEGEGITLVRPLLQVPKTRLIATLAAAGVPYIEDASNRDPRFTRVRLRSIMPALAPEGLTVDRLALLARRAQRAEAALAQAADEAERRLSPYVDASHGVVSGGAVTRKSIEMDAAAFQALPEEIGLRVLARMVGTLGDEGPVELGKLEALYGTLADATSGGANTFGRFRRTLAGAAVTLTRGRLTVERAPPRRYHRP